jgi:hypothetical protein
MHRHEREAIREIVRELRADANVCEALRLRGVANRVRNAALRLEDLSQDRRQPSSGASTT